MDYTANGQAPPAATGYDEPETDLRFDALGKAIHTAYRDWESFRTLNRNLVESYLGPAYGETKDKRKKYINPMRQIVTTYMQQLAAEQPRVDVTTRYKPLRGFAREYETAVNNLIGEIHLEETIRRWVLDAFFCVGIVKVHLADSGQVELEPNIWMDPGSPFASNVSLDDFVCDPSARSIGEIKWAGDMYRIPFASLEEGVQLGMYDPEVAKDVKPSSKYETVDGDRLEAFSRGDETDNDEFEPMVDLCDVYLRSEGRIYTFVVNDRRNFQIKPQPLAWMDWDDPDAGPYHLLGFNEAPENVMPASPASEYDEMDRLINNLLRKSGRQALRQKDNTIYSSEGAETARRMKDSNDGDMIAGDPATVTVIKQGGVDTNNQAFTMGAMQLLFQAAGNIEAMRGSGPQADTATQEELIHGAVNRSIGHMQYQVTAAVRKLIKSLGLMLWHDQFKVIVGKLQVADGVEVDATWRPGDREGRFQDYLLEVNASSLAHRPPGARAQMIMQLLQTVYVPMAEMLMAQGGAVDLQELTTVLSRGLNLPDLEGIITFNSPPRDPEQMPSVEGGKKPPNTTRKYIRQSVSNGGTPQGRTASAQMAWLGAASPQQGTQAMGGG